MKSKRLKGIIPALVSALFFGMILMTLGIDRCCREGILCDGEDGDGDGWSTADGDCDDLDGCVHPGATESCNGMDDNCDMQVDEDCVPDDGDQDGYDVCSDCDDTEANTHPGATEVCDGKDNNCDGQVDEGVNCRLGPAAK